MRLLLTPILFELIKRLYVANTLSENPVVIATMYHHDLIHQESVYPHLQIINLELNLTTDG